MQFPMSLYPTNYHSQDQENRTTNHKEPIDHHFLRVFAQREIFQVGFLTFPFNELGVDFARQIIPVFYYIER